MKLSKTRVCLALLLTATCISFGGIKKEIEASSTTYSLKESNVRPGYTTVWYPTNDTDGFKLTNGGTQIIKINMTTTDNSLKVGFKNSSTTESWYSGNTGNTKTTGELSKTLKGSSGYYKLYVTNNQAAGSITVSSSSYTKVK